MSTDTRESELPSGNDGEADDPVTFSLILGRLSSITEEMAIALEHAAMSDIIALSRDYDCCIYDAGARMLAEFDGCPIHTNSMDLVLHQIQRVFEGEVHAGDVILCNDPYSQNTHVGDLQVTCPVFVEDELAFWVASKGHQMDCGTALPMPGNVWAENVWQDGLTVPPLKIYDRGVARHDVISMYLANVRYRELLKGDLMAMIGSCRLGERRLHEMTEQFGWSRTSLHLNRVIEYSRSRAEAEIRKIPNGVYTAESWLDSDGLDSSNLPIRCTVTVTDDEVSVDFSGSAPQVKSATNAGFGVLQAAGAIPVIMLMPPDIPHNSGSMKRVTVSAPEGTICNASWPAATGSSTVLPGDAMQETVWRALAQAVPEAVRAGTARYGLPVMADSEGLAWASFVTNVGGGGGAFRGGDGWPLISTAAAEGGLKAASVEASELLYPMQFVQWELEPDSMGLGRWIGGPGVRCSVRPLGEPLDVIMEADSQDNPPHGVVGGTAGAGGGCWITDASGRRTFLPQMHHVRVAPDQTWTIVSTGGGGYGDPLEREDTQVYADVRDGLISAERAREIFGVVVREGAEGELVIDSEATEAARAKLTPSKFEHGAVAPTSPARRGWRRRMMGPGDRLLSLARVGMPEDEEVGSRPGA